jgi:hypothetical protein
MSTEKNIAAGQKHLNSTTEGALHAGPKSNAFNLNITVRELIRKNQASTGSTHIPYWSKPYSLRPDEPVRRNRDSKYL